MQKERNRRERENREEFEEQPKKRRKKTRRVGYYLYAVVMLVLTIANIVVATFLLTYVQKIDVNGTTYVQKSQILEWFKSDPYTINSLYAVGKHKIAPPETPPYLESVKVSFSAPWGVTIEVQEKSIVGCVLYEQSYVYFAKDGTVMRKGSEMLDGIPVIEGIHVNHVALYETLVFEEEKAFSYATNIAEQIKKNDLKPDRLVWEEESMNLYFDDICVCLGKINFEEKLTELPPILEELEGKKGVLHLEHYSEMSTNISFVEEKEEPIVDEPETNPETSKTEPETSETEPEALETNGNTPENAVSESTLAEG